MQGFRRLVSSFLVTTIIHPDYKWQLLYHFIVLQLLVLFLCQWIRKAIYCSESDPCKKLFYIEVMHMFQNYFMVLVNFILFFNVTFNVQLISALCFNIIVSLCLSRGIPKTNLAQYAPGLLCEGLNIMQFILLMIVYYLLSLIFYYVSYLILYTFITYPIDLEDMFCIVCDYQDLWNPGWVALVEFLGTLLVEWIMIRKLTRFRYTAEIFCSSAISAFLMMAGYPFVFIFLNPTLSTMKLYSCSKYDPMPTFLTNWLPPFLGAVLGYILFCGEVQEMKNCPNEKGDE